MALPPGIEATGFVDDVRPHLAAAAALIVPLRVGGGTRLKILDALACGKAVVSTTIGCEGLGLVPEKEILVADSPQEFARQVARVCRDGALRNALGKAGRARVERDYSWTTIGEKYRRLLGS
jgi:glycosyltransferase involved in cell wall biosynthesis